MTMYYEETFGPVVPLLTFNNEDEVIESANDSHYGLTGYVFTKDLRRAEKISNRLNYGTIGINNTSVSQPNTAFGGMKYSGIGRESGTYGVEEFLETKFIHTAYFAQ